MNTYQLGDITDEEPPVDPSQPAPAIDAPDAGPPYEAQPFIDQTVAQPLTAPISGQMPEEWPPPVPNEAPGMVPPGGPQAAPPGEPPTSEANIRAEGETVKAEARAQEQQALQAAAEQERHAQEQERIRLETEQRQQEAQDRLDKKIADYDGNHELRDPRSSWTSVDKARNMAATLFGGLGGAFSAAGGGPGGNRYLDHINERLEKETERQKFNIQQASDQVVMARTGVRDAALARAELLHNEDAKHVSRLNTIIAQGSATLSANGVPKAQQATDARLVALSAARDAAKGKAQLDAAKLAEIQARTALYNHKAGKGGGAGGGVSSKEQRAIDREERQDAAGVDKEIKEQLAPVTGKGGLREKITELQHGLKTIDEAPNNPLTWVGVADKLIKTNTGRAAIMSQYNLLMGHAAGKDDTPEQWLQQLSTGLPSQAQRSAIKGVLDATMNTLRGDAAEANKQIHAQYDNDPRVAHNKVAKASYAAQERGAFGQLPGYGQSAAPAAPPKHVPGDVVKQNGHTFKLGTDGKWAPQ